jgi:hypothetical protein
MSPPHPDSSTLPGTNEYSVMRTEAPILPGFNFSRAESEWRWSQLHPWLVQRKKIHRSSFIAWTVQGHSLSVEPFISDQLLSESMVSLVRWNSWTQTFHVPPLTMNHHHSTLRCFVPDCIPNWVSLLRVKDSPCIFTAHGSFLQDITYIHVIYSD